MNPPLFVTRDESLLDELLRLAAAAGVVPDVAADGAAALRGWSAAPVVLVGADLASEVARAGPRRREGVHVVAVGRVPDELFRVALAVGAEHVAELPRSDGWVVDVLTDLGEPTRAAARTLAVIGGSGGAGATVFACAVAQVAARSGPALLVDADPTGPGLDHLLGVESVDGVRWSALHQTTGRLGAKALRDGVPRRRDVGVLTWGPGLHPPLQPFAVREAIAAGRRGHDTVVLDLPRHIDALVAEVVSRCDLVLLVVRPTVAGVASAARVKGRLGDGVTLGLVVRGSGAPPAEVCGVLGVPLVAAMADQKGLQESIDLGAGPVKSHRGPLGRAAAQALASLDYLKAA